LDVVIVGGGLTGCAIAYAAAAAGLKTAVIERDRIGQGSAGRGAGLLAAEPGPGFRDVTAAHGLRSARRVFETARGARFFERTTASKVRFTATHAEITITGGVLQAATVVIATGVAGAEFAPLRRHFKRREAYNVLTEPIAAAIRRQMGDAALVMRDPGPPSLVLRWTDDGRLLVRGAAQDETPQRTRKAVLVQRTGQLMYEVLKMYPAISGLQPEYGWEASYGETSDGLMYIGAHRNYPRHLFALGGHSESVTGAFVAARILGRALQHESEKGDEVFGWAR
jgi:glycine/D-amino acid oxidase-like deaminating enzyme